MGGNYALLARMIKWEMTEGRTTVTWWKYHPRWVALQWLFSSEFPESVRAPEHAAAADKEDGKLHLFSPVTSLVYVGASIEVMKKCQLARNLKCQWHSKKQTFHWVLKALTFQRLKKQLVKIGNSTVKSASFISGGDGSQCGTFNMVQALIWPKSRQH